jgi:hypothetical protein
MRRQSTVGRLLALLGGGALFAAVQAWLFQTATPIPGIEDAGWFLNSGRGVSTVAVTFMVVGALIGVSQRDWIVESAATAAGAAIVMTVVLFSIGPGTIFPIVIVFGTGILGVAIALGASLGTLARRSFGWARS